ncbi:MAG: stage II sporulation protein P [Ruminococcus sp.]|nr:stage II sporulation protein P [Ruminococcus sp.]
MKAKGKLKMGAYACVSVFLIAVAVFSIYVRTAKASGGDGMAVMSALLTISKGNYNVSIEKETGPTEKTKDKAVTATQPVAEKPTTSSEFSQNYYNTFSEHSTKKKYPIYTKQFTVGGKKYENFYVKNNTDYDLNIGKTLKEKMGFKIDKSDDVQVLIYHTHTSESYIDCDVGYYYSDYYPRTNDTRYNVTQVGDEIEKQLKKAGIGVVHDKTSHDNTYTGSYMRSRATIEKYLKKYPKIKVTLDIHRDSIGSDTYKVKPTFTYKGKKGAQIMILTGYDPSGNFNFPNWNYNLRFALRLQKTCETNFSGMTRPLDFGNFAYNMNVNTGSLLIEVGADGNTLDEAKYSGKLLGKALTQVLQNSP